MSAEAEVLAANTAFYAAFGRGDRAAMDALWASRAAVSCIHPGWPPVHGRDKVMSAWGGILDHPQQPPVRPVREVVRVFGDTGVVICYETIGSIVLAATNIFVREEGAWRIVHHQAGVAERAPRDVVEGASTPGRVH
ncbi:MAG: nuclear transport factor 2 family protein [Gemmatimonas sp.]